jgi:foldase protein PrsA
VLTKTKPKAEEARAALKGGQSFKTVAKKFSIDQSSKANGGKLAGVQKGQQEQALDTAIFAAKKGVLTGPVKTQFGYYVFQVSAITPASQQTLAQATPTIKSLLASQGQQKALDAFVKDFQKKWKDRTTCRDGYKISDCKNGPKPKPATSTTAAPTATTGQ